MTSKRLAEIEARLAALEADVALLKEQLQTRFEAKTGWRAIVGTFAGDAMHDRAARYGRDYRKSLRPKPQKRRAKPTKTSK